MLLSIDGGSNYLAGDSEETDYPVFCNIIHRERILSNVRDITVDGTTSDVGRSRSEAGINYRVVYFYNHSITGAYNHKGVCHESKRKETI